jgi:thymidylate synthase (FAD)
MEGRKMKVTLLHNTPLYINAVGARTCWDSHGKSDTGLSEEWCGDKDKELIHRVGNKLKHQSILEHVSYNFYIDGVSRACLQELARHRMASLSVKSTRYTLKELREEESFAWAVINDMGRVKKYVVLTGDDTVDLMTIRALDNLRYCLQKGISNDVAKYCLPEAYKTELTWTINMRSLQNFLSLRSDKSALWEIRNLANAIYEALPEDHKYMYDGYMKSEVTTEMRSNDFEKTGIYRSDEEIRKSAEDFTKYM